MIKVIAGIVLFSVFSLHSCTEDTKSLVTKSVTVGENKCIVQQVPSDFQEGTASEKSGFDYFRVIIESKAKLMDSSHVNYVNFGMETSIRKIIKTDTIFPAFVQRVANGKKENYEYIVSFEKNPAGKAFEILIDDHVFEMGLIIIKF